MNDVIDRLSQAEPSTGQDDRYPAARVLAEVGRITDESAAWSAQARKVRRRGAVTIGAAAALFTLGTGAAAAGWSPLRIWDAFGRNAPGARQLGLAPGPEGTTMALWQAPSGRHQECWTVVVSTPSAPQKQGQASVPDGAVCGDKLRGTFDVITAQSWLSPTTGRRYWIYAGVSGAARRIQLQIRGGRSIDAVIRHGHFMVGPLPVEEEWGSSLKAFDENGRVIHLFGRTEIRLGANPGTPG